MIKTTTWKGLFALIAFLLVAPAFAQNYTAAETKAIEKSKTHFNKGKYDKAISTLNKVLFAHYHDEGLWQLRIQYEKVRYDVQLATDINAIIKKAGKKGTVNVDWDKLKSSTYRTELLFASYMATLYADHQNLASAVLHDMFVRPSVDTAISDEARDLRNRGDEEYELQNWSNAARQYEKAVAEDSTYYGATYDLAFSYYKDEKYEKAEKWFRKCISLQPEMLNPRYFLTEMFIEQKEWDKAYANCLEAMIQYPYTGYNDQMEKICDKRDKTYKRHWMERNDIPNVITMTTQGTGALEPWTYYYSAKEKIADYCNDEGIIKKSQSQTEQKYLETYSWEYMLKKSDTDEKEFGFARKQQENGYLDCYVMFSMFHISFWDQYVHFRDNNRERVKTYIETSLIK